MKKRIYHIIFAVIMIVLLLPVVQEVAGFKFWPLNGYVEPVMPVKLTFKSYRDFSFQNYCKQAAKEHLGFKSFFVRTYNQVLHTLFHESSNQTLIRGKAGHYYLKQYTDDVTGVTLREKFGSVDSARRVARENVLETLRLIDSLKRYDTPLLIVLAPSKTAIYPEYLPNSLQRKIEPFSLQEEYGRLYREYNIPHLDFLPIFREMKQRSAYPLYTRYGTHWNAGTLPFVCDTLLRRIAEVGNFNLPRIQYLDSNISKNYRLGADRELEKTANVLFWMRREPIPNPTYRLTPGEGYDKPKLLIVADSYYTMLQSSCFQEAFEVVDYWKYHEEGISTLAERNEQVPLLDRRKIITEADIVVVMFTSMFAYDHLFGFPRTTLRDLQTNEPFDLEAEIQKQVARIQADPKWMEYIKSQAAERNISVEENLIDNARYILVQERK